MRLIIIKGGGVREAEHGEEILCWAGNKYCKTRCAAFAIGKDVSSASSNCAWCNAMHSGEPIGQLVEESETKG